MIKSWYVLLPLLLTACAWEAMAVVGAARGAGGTATEADVTAGLITSTISVDQELANLVIQSFEWIYQHPAERAPIVQRLIQYLTDYSEQFLSELPHDAERQQIHVQDSLRKQIEEAYLKSQDFHKEFQSIQTKYFEAEKNDEKAWNQLVDANWIFYDVRKETLQERVANPNHRDYYDKALSNCRWTLWQHLSARDSLLKIEKSYLKILEQYTLALEQHAIARKSLMDNQNQTLLVNHQAQLSYQQALESYPQARGRNPIAEGFDPQIPPPQHQLPYQRESERYRQDPVLYPIDMEKIRSPLTADQVVAEELEPLLPLAASRVEHERGARGGSQLEATINFEAPTLKRSQEDGHGRRESRPVSNEQNTLPRLPRGLYLTTSLGDTQKSSGTERRPPYTIATLGANFGKQVPVEDSLSNGNVVYNAPPACKETEETLKSKPGSAWKRFNFFNSMFGNAFFLDALAQSFSIFDALFDDDFSRSMFCPETGMQLIRCVGDQLFNVIVRDPITNFGDWLPRLDVSEFYR